MPNIYFPYMGLSFNIDKIAFSIFGLDVHWYGIILTLGIMCGGLVSSYVAQHERLPKDIIMDFLVIDLLFAILGARIYYVIFKWDYYGQNLLEIFNLRQGGIAIYGGIIASVAVAAVFTKKKRVNLWQFGDVMTYGLLVGQIIGRFGNFVNKEAFGDYTDNFFAMRILQSEAATSITQNILDNVIVEEGLSYIQVHPTFLYESMWNLGLLAVLAIFYRFRKGKGEIFFLYVAGYGVGRFWIEGLRTDQLVFGGAEIAISQVVAIISIIIGGVGFYMCRKSARSIWR
ncbi:MAG: prolipoprotein diacylglyceryl transferase [Epulopiscium sp. Nele67-Bin004]|nr:MAG: prolipoprotein diacylglyceryl transferase [Epulopiscium sp. Nele67-Bin004]